jgi:uncharacterized membrane protein YfcA
LRQSALPRPAASRKVCRFSGGNPVDSLPLLLAIAGIFVLAGLVKGTLGLGLPTVAIGLLSLFMTPAQAIVLLAMPTMTTNLWQLFIGPSLWPLFRRLWPMLVAILFGAWLGRDLLVASNGLGTAVLGGVLAVYSILGLTAVKFHVPPHAEWWLAPIIGVINGVVSAASGLFSIPGVPYMEALGLNKDDLVQALGLSFTTSMIALAIILSRAGMFHASVAIPSAVALVAAFAGLFIGQALRNRVPAKTFRKVFFVAMLLLGLDLALKAVL